MICGVTESKCRRRHQRHTIHRIIIRADSNPMNTSMSKTHYLRLIIMTVLSFISMYILMYAMVDVFANVFPNFNQFYMSGLMASPMVLIEIFLMSAMYPNKKWNALIIAVTVQALSVFSVGNRQPAA